MGIGQTGTQIASMGYGILGKPSSCGPYQRKMGAFEGFISFTTPYSKPGTRYLRILGNTRAV